MPKDEEKKKKKTPATDDNGDAGVKDEEVQRLLESGVWKAMKQEGTGRTYYYHTKTKQTCWDLKKELLKQRRAQENGGAAEMAADEKAAARKVKGSRPTEKKEEDTTEKRGTEPSESAHGVAAAPLDFAASVTGQPTNLTAAPATPHTDGADGGSNMNDARNARGDDSHQKLLPLSEKGRELMQIETYRDPLERLMDETKSLEQLMVSSGTSQAMALEFQRSYEALARTNKALTTQMVKMKQEYGAMELALKEANVKVYEKDRALRELQCRTRAENKEDEAERTLVFLREQNQELIRQVGELTVVLSRGFNELAYQQALTTGPGAINPEQLAANPALLNQKDSLGTTLDRVLSNAVTQSLLCSACTGELEKLRFSLLSDEERAVASPARGTRPSTAVTGVDHFHHAHYVPAVSPAPAFHPPDRPEATPPGGMNSDDAGRSSGYFQRHAPPPLSPSSPPQQQQQQQRQGYYGANDALGIRQPSSSAPRADAAQYPHSRNGVGLQSYPYSQQRLSPGEAYGRTSWRAQVDDDGNDTYADHFPTVAMTRRSESRTSAVSATPVFGGFRIRPSY